MDTIVHDPHLQFKTVRTGRLPSSRKITDIIGVRRRHHVPDQHPGAQRRVEAARAGEPGRGFAVVASEVRSLALQAAQAAKEINGLIDSSVYKSRSTRLFGEAGTTMNDIVASVRRVSKVIAEILQAAGEQADGLRQVNVAVRELDHVTRQNVALVQSAAAAESMREQTMRLTQAVGTFKLHAACARARRRMSATRFRCRGRPICRYRSRAGGPAPLVHARSCH